MTDHKEEVVSRKLKMKTSSRNDEEATAHEDLHMLRMTVKGTSHMNEETRRWKNLEK